MEADSLRCATRHRFDVQYDYIKNLPFVDRNVVWKLMTPLIGLLGLVRHIRCMEFGE